MRWRDCKWTGVALRLAGLALLCVAVLVGRHIFARPDPAAKHSLLAYVLAAVAMLSGCAGAALTLLGRHLFDRVELSSRWIVHSPPGSRVPTG